MPVLLSLASWDLSEKFSDWVVGQLNSLYPELQNRARFGAKAAEALVRTRRVITLLDGLDEMAPDLRGGALAEINRWLVADGDAVVSCRSDEYQEVLTAGGEPLRSAPVIVLEDVSPDSAGEYMSGDQPSAWRRVIGQLAADEENGSLRDVLGNPLMISLARRTYGAGGERAPDDLVDLATTSTGEQVRRSLLEAIVPVAFRAGADNKMISREWASRKARRWLVNLAQEAGRTPDAELRWWQLPSRGSILSRRQAHPGVRRFPDNGCRTAAAEWRPYCEHFRTWWRANPLFGFGPADREKGLGEGAFSMMVAPGTSPDAVIVSINRVGEQLLMRVRCTQTAGCAGL